MFVLPSAGIVDVIGEFSSQKTVQMRRNQRKEIVKDFDTNMVIENEVFVTQEVVKLEFYSLK